MKKIKVQQATDGHYTGLYNIVDVTDETYRIIERSVIKIATDNPELQHFLLEKSKVLPMLMDSSITVKIYNDALRESIDNIKNKKIWENL